MNSFSNVKNEKENNIENNAESTFNWRVRLDVLNIKNEAEEDSQVENEKSTFEIRNARVNTNEIFERKFTEVGE